MLLGCLMALTGSALANPDTGLDEPGEPATERAYPHTDGLVPLGTYSSGTPSLVGGGTPHHLSSGLD